jgi:G3E family GTPase
MGFADRLFLSKLHLISTDERAALSARLSAMNLHALQVLPVAFGQVALTEVFDIGGFDMVDTLDLRSETGPQPCAETNCDHPAMATPSIATT